MVRITKSIILCCVIATLALTNNANATEMTFGTKTVAKAYVKTRGGDTAGPVSATATIGGAPSADVVITATQPAIAVVSAPAPPASVTVVNSPSAPVFVQGVPAPAPAPEPVTVAAAEPAPVVPAPVVEPEGFHTGQNGVGSQYWSY